MLTISEVLNHIRKNEYENAIYLYLPFSIILVLTLFFVYYDDIRMIVFDLKTVKLDARRQRDQEGEKKK